MHRLIKYLRVCTISLAGGFLCTACLHLPAENPAYFACRNSCLKAKDQCILEARNASQLQTCNQQLPACLQACPAEYVQQGDADEP